MAKAPDTPLTPDQLYCNLMEEINGRLHLMEAVLNGKFTMHPMLAEELCYFQLRMLCETFACALLVAHGTITGFGTDSLKREWSADAIFKRVQKLYESTPHTAPELGTGSFYPVPCALVSVDDNAGAEIATRAVGEGDLTAPEFLQLYGITHSRTHRGAIKDFSKRAPYVDVDFQPIIRWAHKLANLLVQGHLIQSPDRKKAWLVVLRRPDTGRPSLVQIAFP